MFISLIKPSFDGSLFLLFNKIKMERYFIIQDREAGNYIEHFNNYEDAVKELKRYEEEDMKDGIYEENFYEIKEVEEDELKEILERIGI